MNLLHLILFKSDIYINIFVNVDTLIFSDQ